MKRECNYCGERLSIKKSIAQFIRNKAGRRITKWQQIVRVQELENMHLEDRKLLSDLVANYNELASCYRSMQSALSRVRDSYREFLEVVTEIEERNSIS